jgi:acetylornithine deacetylase/succinyl-diaminopimelate desuccinylase-like protein
VDAMLARLTREIGALGGNVRVVQTPELPVLFATIDAKAPRTVLVHCMYDTVPANEPGWQVPPFEARRLDFEDLGDCIVGRGAEDTKGPYTALLNAIASYRAAGVPLPINVMLVMEASELGSGGIADFVHCFREELSCADLAYFPWNTERADGTAVVWLGAKGLITLKLRAKGGAWGGPARGDLHGSHAGWVASPTHRLIHALASLRSSADGDVAIDGFHGGRDPPTEAEHELTGTLARRTDGRRLLDELGAVRFKQEGLRAALEAYNFKPEFNVSGLKAGLVVEGGHKAHVPHEAVASIEIRPLSGMRADTVITAMRSHLDRHGYPEIAIELMNSYDGGGTPVGNWAVQELLQCYADCGYDPEIWPRTARSIASGLYTRELGLPWIATMPGHAGRQHAANEFITVKGYRSAIAFVIRLLWRLGNARPDVA